MKKTTIKIKGNDIIKTYNFCNKCSRKYPLDIRYCPKCNTLLFPIPYFQLDEGCSVNKE